MSRAPVTIAILAWNSWDTTRTCLDSLRPTLGPRDQVVVVDNGSTDTTPTGLANYPWVHVVTNAVNRGFAGGCNDAAAEALHDAIIFLNNDTVLPQRWIDPLAAAFDDPSVGAAGARSNFVSGPQVVEGANYRTTAEMRRFAREWSSAHRGERSDAERLVGFCLAVRRSAFEHLGGFDEGYGTGGFEDDDLCQRLIGAGYRLVVCHDSFVHHEGHRTFDANGLDWLAEQEANRERFLAAHGAGAGARRAQLVSACLIVKDEEEQLAQCLGSLAGFADEIVVYDTGSEDGTVELARTLGATVVEGYWDDDFSRARNAALEHCHGEWIAWLDADETLQAPDHAALRSLLASTKPEIDAWSVRIHNLTGTGMGSEFIHHASRLFRRARCEWTGRLHEQVAVRASHGAIRQAELEDAWIRHTGYTDEALRSRDKAARNLRVAQEEVERSDGWNRAYSVTSLARSLLLAGRPEEALAQATAALDGTGNAITRRLATRTAIDACLALGRFAEAVGWCDRLRTEGGDRQTVGAFEADARLALGQFQQALELVLGLEAGYIDPDGYGQTAPRIAATAARAYGGLGRFAEAADALLAVLMEEGVLDTHLGDLVDYLRRSGRSLDALAAAIPPEQTVMFLAQVLQLQTDPADAVLEACFTRQVDRVAVLATASSLALRLPLDRALVWSSRLRDAGYASACPLVALAGGGGPPVGRARAAATAAGAFADPRGFEQFWSAYNSASPSEKEAIRGEAGQLCPALLAGVVAQ